MKMAEVGLFVAVLVAPIVLGAWAGATRRPWWWAAVASVTLMLVAALAPEPEAGESRVAAGDLVFLLVVAAFVSGLAWLSAWVARRLTGRKPSSA